MLPQNSKCCKYITKNISNLCLQSVSLCINIKLSYLQKLLIAYKKMSYKVAMLYSSCLYLHLTYVKQP